MLAMFLRGANTSCFKRGETCFQLAVFQETLGPIKLSFYCYPTFQEGVLAI